MGSSMGIAWITSLPLNIIVPARTLFAAFSLLGATSMYGDTVGYGDGAGGHQTHETRRTFGERVERGVCRARGRRSQAKLRARPQVCFFRSKHRIAHPRISSLAD